MKIHPIAFASLLFAGLAAPASAAVLINEVFANAPGTDNGAEYFEIRSTTGATALTGLTFLVIEGGAASAGVVDVALSLGSFSTGTNGLFLWRDSVTTLSPAPNAATTVNVADFAPDLENGSQTYLLVSGFTGAQGDDLDTDGNGILDITPWTSVIDAIGVTENPGDIVYGASLGFLDFGDLIFTPDVVFRTANVGWVGADGLGTNPGPYTVDPANVTESNYDASTPYQLTPGNDNGSIALLPEPTSTVLALLGVAGLALRRRRN